MASYRKTKTGWRVEICIDRARDSATFDTKAQCRAWADQREEEIRGGGIATTSGKTVGDAFDKYAEEVSPGKRGERWERVRLKLLGRDRLSEVLLSDLSKAHLIDWRDRRLKEVAQGSVRREMNLIGSVLETARAEWQWLADNPSREVKKPKDSRARTRRPTEDEIERICLALGWWERCKITDISQRVAVAYLFAIETAMRAGEICGLLPEHVDLKRRVAHLPMTKNGLARDVPLSKRAVELLKQLQPWGDTVFQVGSGTLDTLFRRARDNCGIEGLRFHDSRREATSRLAKKLHPLELARVTGHTNLSQLLTYYNESAEELAKKI